MDDEAWLARAVELALENVAAGGRPFGAIVVRDGEELATGVNRALQDSDPTAHAELLAIREAARRLGSLSLAGATVYASGEPCPMCRAAAQHAGVSRLVFAAASQIAIDVGLGPASPEPPLEHLPIPGAERPFEAWHS
jgi:tRNA(Arg) A34 adenosine deaminase TadA